MLKHISLYIVFFFAFTLTVKASDSIAFKQDTVVVTEAMLKDSIEANLNRKKKKRKKDKRQELVDKGRFVLGEEYGGPPLTINLEEDEEESETAIKKKKKRVKKNTFYGIKTRKGFTKKGFGDKIVLETFFYLKEHQSPDPYIRDIYWYDLRSKKIRKSRKINLKYGSILHGPYKKTRGGKVIEEGFFYIGTKHKRWTQYSKRDVLINKITYVKGWTKDSKITYYDIERTRIKEVIPVEYGENEGYYYKFHPNGLLAVVGEYKFGNKVGIWKEYYNRKRRPKKEVKYPDNPFNEKFIPFTQGEWNLEGKMIFKHD